MGEKGRSVEGVKISDAQTELSPPLRNFFSKTYEQVVFQEEYTSDPYVKKMHKIIRNGKKKKVPKKNFTEFLTHQITKFLFSDDISAFETVWEKSCSCFMEGMQNSTIPKDSPRRIGKYLV